MGMVTRHTAEVPVSLGTFSNYPSLAKTSDILASPDWAEAGMECLEFLWHSLGPTLPLGLCLHWQCAPDFLAQVIGFYLASVN